MGTSNDTKRLGYRQLIYNIDSGKFFYELPGDQYQELPNIDDLPPLGNGWINIGPNVYYPADLLIGGIEGNIQLKASGSAVFNGSISCQTVTFGDGTTQTTAFGGDTGVISVNNQTGVVTLTTNDLPNTAGFITVADIPESGASVNSVNGQTGTVLLDIPENTSDLNNDSGFITLADVPSGGGGDGGAVSSVNGQTGDVVIDTFSGDYADLTNKPAIPTNNNQLVNGASYITSAQAPVQPGDLFSGDYDDLINKPVIPTNNNQLVNGAGYITSADTFSGDYADLTNKPVLFSGDYADLTNKPTIPTDNNQLTNGAGYITSADTFSGDYTDLTNKPTIPTDNNQLTNGAGYITASDIPSQSIPNLQSVTNEGSNTTNDITIDTNKIILFANGNATFFGTITAAGFDIASLPELV